MTEHQPYDVVARHPGFELRRYPEHVVAEVEVTGSFESAGNTAFRPLAGYIGGRNRSRSTVAMTAPVVQERLGSEKIAMTAPVVQQEGADADRYVVRFVMPAGSTLESLPVPEDARVTIRAVPSRLAAVRRFSGRWSRASFEEHAAALRTAVGDAGLEIDAPLQFARFDPPWTPWFLRHNEVVAPVVEP